MLTVDSRLLTYSVKKLRKPNRMNSNKSIPMHIINLLKTEDKRKHFESDREKHHHTYRENSLDDSKPLIRN